MSKLADARPWRKGPEVRYAHSSTLGQDERARRCRLASGDILAETI